MSFQQLIFLLTAVVSVFCHTRYEAPACQPERYTKVLFNQTSIGQYIEYDVKVPELTGFTLHYWVKILRSTPLATTFSYFVDGADNKEYVQLTLLKIGHSWFSVLQVKGVVVSNTKLPGDLEGEWHHLLHSWDGVTGAWSLYFDGKLVEEGESPRSEGLVVKGGGRVFTGQQASAVINSFSTSCYDIGKFQEGVDGWVTLLSLDSRAITRPKYWVNRMAVAVVASGCHAEHKGDIIRWVGTPRRGYCGVLETRANNVCGNF